jgi:hypothetical protein
MTLRIPQGTTHRRTWPAYTGAGVRITDWSGWTGRGQVRATADAPAVLHEWTTADETLLLDEHGVTLLTRPEDSLPWSWRDGFFDIEMTDPEGAIARYPIDRVVVVPAVTRDQEG